MTKSELYKVVNIAIFSAPACPDGANGMACPSCMSEAVADAIWLELSAETDGWPIVTPL